MTESIPVYLAEFWKRSNETGNQGIGQSFNMTDPATLASLENTIRDAHTVEYGIAVAAVIWTYDYMLTVGDEIELFWRKADYKATRVLFLVVRLMVSSSLATGYRFKENHNVY
jgi:hypothetical protein